MDIIRLIGVIVVEYPRYLLSSNYDSSTFWNKCIRINILYTKVLQAIAVHYISDTFYYHFNDIPYTSDEIPEIEHITPKNVIGSGMISIVIEGTDEKGSLYIVKSKRKGIDAKIMQGLQQLKNIVWWLHYLPFQFPIHFIYTQFETMILEQLSFENEIKHHQQFKKNNIYNTNIVIPDIIDAYCTPMQIVMTKIEGSHYSPAISSELCNTYVQYITEMTTKNIIIDGFIHSDLHAGNMLFTPDHKIGVIDFGLMIRLTVKERQSFFDLLQHLSMQEYEKGVDVIITQLLEPQHIIKSLSDIQLRALKQSFIDLYIRIYSIQKSLYVKDICSIIYIAYTYNLTVSVVFYKLMFFVVSCQCFIHKLSPFYFHSFINKLKELFTEMNEDE